MDAIGIDYTPAYEQGGGIGRYVRELVAALAPLDTSTDYRLFVAGARELPPSPGSNFTWKPTSLSPVWLARIWHRARIPLPIETFTGRVKLHHATDFVLPPTLPGTRTLLTVHDLSFVRVPEAASPNLKAYLDRVVPRSARRADHILADSQATKDDLISVYNLPPSKITVLLSGVDPRFHRVDDAAKQQAVREKYGLGAQPYIFSVGTVQPRKNYGRLIQALAEIRARGYPHHLVIAGGKGWLEDPIYQTVRETHLERAVHFIGFADETDLPTLYSGADCFAFPSLYEGFGIPVLESMACGTPVVTSNISSLPEAAGNAALLVDPYSVEAISNSLLCLIEDTNTRQELVRQGYQHVQNFTWTKAAEQLRALYSDLL